MNRNWKRLELLDQNIVLSIQEGRRPFLNRFFILITQTGSGRAFMSVLGKPFDHKQIRAAVSPKPPRGELI